MLTPKQPIHEQANDTACCSDISAAPQSQYADSPCRSACDEDFNNTETFCHGSGKRSSSERSCVQYGRGVGRDVLRDALRQSKIVGVKVRREIAVPQRSMSTT